MPKEPIHTQGPRTTATSKSEGRLIIGLKKRGKIKRKSHVLKNILNGKGGIHGKKSNY